LTGRTLAAWAAGCALVLAGVAAPVNAAGLYKCKTVGGRIVFSDRPCTQEALGKEDLKLATPPPAAAQPPERSPHDSAYSPAGVAERKPATAPEAEAPGGAEENPARARLDGTRREEKAERQAEGQAPAK
jgi:hypothetical protein